MARTDGNVQGQAEATKRMEYVDVQLRGRLKYVKWETGMQSGQILYQ